MRRHVAPVRSKDGSTLVKDEECILDRWQERFSQLLIRDSRVELETTDNVPQTLAGREFDDPPFLEEVYEAIK